MDTSILDTLFLERLRAAQEASASLVCVGLDPVVERLPEVLRDQDPVDAVRSFCLTIIEATAPFACAYKPNFAFFEALGSEGYRVLEEIVEQIPTDHLVIADAKRGDIGHTGRMYARAFFEQLGCDACTISPYMGRDSVTPFLNYSGTAVFVLGRTSNAGARDVQELIVEDTPLYLHVSRAAVSWGAETPGTVGLVVGATDPEALKVLRESFPTTPFLIPGLGAQGGSIDDVCHYAAREEAPVLINSSRGILYASSGADFAEAAVRATRRLRDTLNTALSAD